MYTKEPGARKEEGGKRKGKEKKREEKRREERQGGYIKKNPCNYEDPSETGTAFGAGWLSGIPPFCKRDEELACELIDEEEEGGAEGKMESGDAVRRPPPAAAVAAAPEAGTPLL